MHWWGCRTFPLGGLVSAESLPASSLRLARRYAKAQVPDSAILGALRARARESIDDPEALALVLLSLQTLSERDQADLDDFRDLGRATVQLITLAAALGRKLNAQQEEYEGEHSPGEASDYAEVTPLMASMCQFVGRTYCSVDPRELREEAAREARVMSEMSAAELRAELKVVAGSLGLRLVEAV